MSTQLQCIIKITSEEDISLPQNGKALLTALDGALEKDMIDIFYVGNSTDVINLETSEGEGLSTYVRFEFEGDPEDPQTMLQKIREQICHACSPEILSADANHQLVMIDYCAFNFKM